MQTPRLQVQFVEHSVLSSFVEIVDWDLTMLVARDGQVRPLGTLDEAWRRKICAAVTDTGDVYQIGAPAPRLNTKTRYYGEFEKALGSDGILGRPGRRLLQRSPSDTSPIDLDHLGDSIDEVLAAHKRIGAELACRDEDCDGERHGWLRLELPSREFVIWHVNPTTGAVVPPTPLVLH